MTNGSPNQPPVPGAGPQGGDQEQSNNQESNQTLENQPQADRLQNQTPRPLERQINRPTIQQAKNMPWWRRLFGDNNQTPDIVAQAGDAVRQGRQQFIREQEGQREIDRVIRPERIRQPRDVYELMNVVEQLDARSFRARQLNEKYGEGLLDRCRAGLENEEFYYNVSGEVQHDWWAEFKRRALDIVTDRRVLAGAAGLAVVGILTGGIGVAAMGGALGALAGRGLGETFEAIYGKDRKIRSEIAQLQYEHFMDLQRAAQEVRNAENDQERIRNINKLIDLYYSESQDMLQAKSKLTQTKEDWDKIKGYITMAGSLAGVAYGISGAWQEASKAGIEKVKFYNFDNINPAHSIEKLNNGEWIYHIRDAQENITGTHTLGGVPTAEALKNFTIKEFVNESAREAAMKGVAYDVGKGAAVLLSAGLAHFLGKGPETEIATNEREFSRGRERILRDVPLSTESGEQNPEQREREIKTGQVWTFDFVRNLGELRNANTYEQMMFDNVIDIPNPNDQNNPFKVPFGSYRVENIDGDRITIALLDPQIPGQICLDDQNNQIQFIISRESLNNLGLLDTRAEGEQKFHSNFIQLAEHFNKEIPLDDQIWRFTQGNYPGFIIPSRNVVIPGGRNRWRVKRVEDNYVTLEPLEDNRDVIARGAQDFRIHIVDLLNYGNPVRTERNVEDDRKVLDRLNINPEDLSSNEYRFMSPNVNILDVNGQSIPINQLFRLINVDLNRGRATMESVNEINMGGRRERPRFIVNVRVLESLWRAQASPERNTQGQAQPERENRGALDQFREEVARGLSLSDEERDSIKKGSVFEIGSNLYAFQSFNPNAGAGLDQIVFYPVNIVAPPAVRAGRGRPVQPLTTIYEIDRTAPRQNYRDIAAFLAARPEIQTGIQAR